MERFPNIDVLLMGVYRFKITGMDVEAVIIFPGQVIIENLFQRIGDVFHFVIPQGGVQRNPYPSRFVTQIANVDHIRDPMGFIVVDI
jgi:hypothetical protein